MQNFCWYEDGRVVDCAPPDCFGGEFEVTEAVFPAYRRQGIFRQLFAADGAKAAEIADRQLLLVSDPQFQLGTAIARKLSTDYLCSEYRMGADASSVPPLPQNTLYLWQITAGDILELSNTLNSSFEGGRWSEPNELLLSLDVETKNAQALSLYLNCGFRETMLCDYSLVD